MLYTLNIFLKRPKSELQQGSQNREKGKDSGAGFSVTKKAVVKDGGSVYQTSRC